MQQSNRCTASAPAICTPICAPWRWQASLFSVRTLTCWCWTDAHDVFGTAQAGYLMGAEDYDYGFNENRNSGYVVRQTPNVVRAPARMLTLNAERRMANTGPTTKPRLHQFARKALVGCSGCDGMLRIGVLLWCTSGSHANIDAER